MGIDLIRFAAPVAGSALLEWLLRALDFLANGLVAAGIGLAIAARGFVARDRRWTRAGLAIVFAVAAAGFLTNVLKLVFKLPRPGHGVESFSFPSGHATSAFAVAAVLGRAFPAVGPLLYVLAVFAGLARVYYRDHFVVDVVGGAVLGGAVGLAAAKWLPRRPERTEPRRARWAWAVAAAVAIPPVAWLALYERELASHLVREEFARPRGSVSVAIRFGTPEARLLLGKGWSGDERWNGRVPFVWAEGLESSLRLPPLSPTDHRARFRVIPFVRGGGLSCQVMSVAWNGAPVGRLLLERGWNVYELGIPGRLIRPDGNEMELRFEYAEAPGGRDTRRLSVAFQSLEFVPERAESRAYNPTK